MNGLEHVTGRIPKLAGGPVSGLRFRTSFSKMTIKLFYLEKPLSSRRLPTLVDHITDQVPHLVLPSVKDNRTGDTLYRFFNPINERIIGIKKKSSSVLPDSARHFWSSHGLLTFVDFKEGGLYLWAPPFSSSSDLSSHVIKLPSVESLPSVFRVTRKKDGSVEKFRTRGRGSVCFALYDVEAEEYRFLVRQLAFSSLPSSASTSSNSSCTVMAVQGAYADLAFCKLGDATWTDLPASHGDGYDSVAYCSKDQLFYAVSDAQGVEAWDVRDPSSIKRISVDRYMDYPMPPKYKGLEARLRMKSNKKHYLLESSGDLLLVVRHYFREWSLISHSKKDN